ncbi:MAG: hypothetical protein U0470_07440 [Anaerolineae bacterium]
MVLIAIVVRPAPSARAQTPPHRLYLPLALVPAAPGSRTLAVPARYATIAAALAAARAGDAVVQVGEGRILRPGCACRPA